MQRKMEGVRAWPLVQTQQISVNWLVQGDMCDIRHKANKTNGEVFGTLFLPTPCNHLPCPYMQMALIPFNHTIPTKQPSTRVNSRQILRYHHSSLGPSTCD